MHDDLAKPGTDRLKFLPKPRGHIFNRRIIEPCDFVEVRVIELLHEEVVECLGLLGLSSFAGLDHTYLRAAESVTEPGVHSAFPLLTLPVYKY